MEDIQELKEQRSHLLLSANDIANEVKKANRPITAEETTRTNELLAQADEIDSKIDTIKKSQAQLALIEDRVSDLSRPEPRKTIPAQPGTGGPVASISNPAIPRRYGKLKAFKGERADYHAYESGMWMCATLLPQNHPLRARGHEWCREHGVYQQIQNAMSTGTPSAGGNLVPDALSQTIIDLREQYGIFRQWCDVVPLPNGSVTIPRRSGSVTPYWIGEGAALTASDAAFDNVRLTAKKLTAFTKISSELSEDSIVNVVDWLTMDIGQQLAYEEDRVGFRGTGLDTDGGIRGVWDEITAAGSAGSYINVATATHNTFAELDATDIMTLMAACPQYALSDAAFFISQSGAALTFGRLMAAAGGNTQQSLSQENISADRGRGIVGYYQGYPIVVSQVLPVESDTKTSLPMMAFGSLRRAAVLGETRTVQFATDSSVYFASDQLAIRATARIDINVHSLGSATAAGPLVVLKGGSS